MNKKILVIAAHPDDEVLGAGGTIAKRAKEGWSVSVVFCATGVEGRLEKKQAVADAALRRAIESLNAESAKAAKMLGVKTVHRLNFPDNRLDSVPKMDIAFALRKIVEREKPSVVFTHHHGDYNWDHAIVFEAAMMACRPNAGDFFPAEIYSFEVLSSTERAFQNPQSVFAPDYFVSIEETIAAKKAALMAYRSEVHPYPHPRSPEAVENLARKRGNEVGLYFAEAFRLVRRIGG